MSDTHGKVIWTELMTRDVAGAKAYYGAVCGWRFETMPMMDGTDYHLGMRDGVPVIGMMDMTDMDHLKGAPPYWFSYFAVDDVDAAVAATTAAGGKVLRAPFEVPGTGRIALLEDPTGAAMGLMTPAPMG
jgi:predicted enzyme related to lactoylglutathione lyase